MLLAELLEEAPTTLTIDRDEILEERRADSLPRSVLDCWEPVEPVHPVQWVEENIYLSRKHSAVPGYWSHSRFPYSVGVLEAWFDPTIREIVLDWGTQLGKTTLLGGLAGWVADNAPSSIMIGCPNMDSAHEHYDTKLEPMLEACMPVKDRLPPKHRRRKELVDLTSCWIYYAWAGSKSTLSGRSIRFLFITEVNLWSNERGAEGDPVEMARDRCKAFPNSKILVEGKPTTEETCRITAAYNKSDRRTYHVPCPKCGEWQQLEMGTEGGKGGLKWERDENGDSDPQVAERTAYYECCECAGKLIEQDKLIMIRKGRWVREGQHVDKESDEIVGEAANPVPIAGFHLPSLYSTVITWGEFASKFVYISKYGTQDDLRAFINGWLAECWKVDTRKTTPSAIASHIMAYEPGTVPETPIEVMATVDVQEDNLWYVIRAWGTWGTSWLVRYGYLPGWDELDQILSEPVLSPQGACMVTKCWIDSGYRTQEVYDYCKRYGNAVQPVKGQRQFSMSSIVRVSNLKDQGVQLHLIDKGISLNQLYDRRLKIKVNDPGFWAIYDGVDTDYLRALATYKRIINAKGVEEWISGSRDYEHLADCENYQEALACHLGLGFRTHNQRRPPPRGRSTKDSKRRGRSRQADGLPG